MTLFWSLGWFFSNKLDNPSFQKFQILVLNSLFRTFEYLCSVLMLILVNKCFKALTWFFKIYICFKTNFLSIYPCTLWWFTVSLKPPTFKYIGNNFSFLLFMFLDSLRSYFVRSREQFFMIYSGPIKSQIWSLKIFAMPNLPIRSRLSTYPQSFICLEKCFNLPTRLMLRLGCSCN